MYEKLGHCKTCDFGTLTSQSLHTKLETLNQWPVSTDIMVGCLWGSTFPPYLGLQLVKGSTNLLRGHNQLFCWVWLSQVSPKPLPNHKLLTLNPALHPVGPQSHEDYCVLWGPSQDFLVHFLNFLKPPKPYLVSTLPCHISFGVEAREVVRCHLQSVQACDTADRYPTWQFPKIGDPSIVP